MLEPDSARLGRIMQAERERSGLSRQRVAISMGVSPTTVKNWEIGLAEPSYTKLVAYCKAIGVPRSIITQAYEHEEMDGLDGCSPDEDVDRAFRRLFSADAMPMWVKRQMLFLRSGHHGGDPIALLQMMVAHAQSPLFCRCSHTNTIISDYMMSANAHMIQYPDHAQPQLEILATALDSANSALKEGMRGYTNGGSNHAKKE